MEIHHLLNLNNYLNKLRFVSINIKDIISSEIILLGHLISNEIKIGISKYQTKIKISFLFLFLFFKNF